MARKQLMNASFDPLHLVNTYGAFGSISRTRDEVVVEGTGDSPATPESVWRTYEFRGKPTDPQKRPSQWAPYHLRLDWLTWFGGICPSSWYPWFVPLMEKFGEGDLANLRVVRAN